MTAASQVKALAKRAARVAMPRRLSCVGLALLIGTAAAADDLADLNAAFDALINPLLNARAEYHACRERFPDRAVALQDSYSAWYHRHEMAEAERAIAAVTSVDAGVSAQLDNAERRVKQAARQEIAANPDICARFADMLAEDYDPGNALQRMKRGLRAFRIELPPPPHSPHEQMQAGKVMPLALLSARIEAVMATIGSREGAASNRYLREARAAEAEAWLEAHPTLLISGRVISEDRIREWRGDQQSRFALRCRSFDNDAAEADFARLQGTEVVVSGQLRSVNTGSDGGLIVLERCATRVSDSSVAAGDDSGGLMLRPPEADEVYAGPGAGIASRAVAHLLYDANFDFRIDGFGNSYTDRDEAVWLLLKDGSAYLHTWSFPFSDLNVPLSKAREPDKWLRWRPQGDDFVLIGADGELTELTGAQALVSPETGFRPEARYYFLQIGMGGRRSDRSYIFHADGTVTHRRGGFVAGNVGTGYLISSGSSTTPITSSYRFEDFALVLKTADGEVRHFVALPASDDRNRPGTLLIGGEAYWLETKD